MVSWLSTYILPGNALHSHRGSNVCSVRRPQFAGRQNTFSHGELDDLGRVELDTEVELVKGGGA